MRDRLDVHFTIIKEEYMKKVLKIIGLIVASLLSVMWFVKAFSLMFITGNDASVGKGIFLLVLLFLAWIFPIECVRAKNQSRHLNQ